MNIHAINLMIALFVACIIIGAASLVGFIIALCKYKKKKTNGNAAALSTLPLLFICCIIGSIFIGIGRSADNKDIYIDLNQTISMNMDFDLKPHSDINGLEITFEFVDKNYDTVTKITKKVGNVEEGKQYKISISLSEFGITDIFKINKVSAEVTGGRVSYFG